MLRSESFWRDVIAVHRLNGSVLILAICSAWTGACFAASDFAQLATPATLFAAAATILLFLGGLALNSFADIDTDAHHPDKATLAGAARRSGKRIARWSVVEIGCGIAAAAAVTAITTHPWAVIAGIATAAAHASYNVGPLRLKHRGLPGALVFGAASGGLPFLVSVSALVPSPPGWAWWLAAGLTGLAAGRTAWWSVPDARADRAAGANTLSVRYGTRVATAVACALMLAGLVATAGTVLRLFGPVQSVVAVSAHAVVLGTAVAAIIRPQARFLSMRTMYRRVLRLVALGNVLLVAVPLAALR